MTKTILTIIIGVAVIGGGYFLIKSNMNKVKDTSSEKAGVVQEQPTGKKMAFSQFVKQGGAYKCEVKQSLSDMENSGTVYINGGNISGEYSTIAEGKNIQTSFMMKDGYSYTWSSSFPTMGFKVKIPTEAEVNTNANTQGTYSWNADQIGDYNCESWTVDQSKFTIPTNIKFTAVGDIKL